ncbi:ABC transporter ATP-binding protein [bacterium]|nr:ABC transporter ATP-binding protein [bacterium]
MKDVLLKMTDIHKSYPMAGMQVDVLKGVDLDLESGGVLAVVGASGAGKSTLLHIIGALDRPTKGGYHYKDHDVFKCSDRELAGFRNSTIGFIFQFHHLLPEFTALENIMMPLMISGKAKKEEIREKAQTLLKEVGLENREFHRPSELSGGEQQRVAIARALANDPELILADEPTGNLDTQTSHSVFDLLVGLNSQRGMSMIFVTHNMELAKKAKHRLRLKDGVVLD